MEANTWTAWEFDNRCPMYFRRTAHARTATQGFTRLFHAAAGARKRKWQEIDARRFGIGNISLAGGGKFKPHDSHRNGLQVDVRPLRKDGRHAGVKYFESGYDRDATAKLIRLFTEHPFVTKVYFNDRRIRGVFPMDSHDNHFHVEIMAATS